MNPFTKFLSQWVNRPDLHAFVQHWDELERVVVAVYREKMTLAAAAEPFARVWPWLRHYYPHWEASLRPYWQQTRAAGAVTQTDPFQLLLDKQSPDEIPGDWRAMQHLPAAREALNQFILSQSPKK